MRFLKAFAIVSGALGIFSFFVTDVSITGAVTGRIMDVGGSIDAAFISAIALFSISFVSFFVDMRRNYGVDEKTDLGRALNRADMPLGYDSRLKKVEDIVIDTIQKEFADVNSIGSSYRQTYIPGKADIDLYIHSGEGLNTLAKKSDEFKGILERKLDDLYGTEIKVVQRKIGTSEGRHKLFYTVIDQENGKPLLNIDTNYSADKGVKDYNLFFEYDVENITSKIAGPAKDTAQDYLKANIRGLKALLDDHGLYKPKDGGIGGVGIEQLFLQMHERPALDIEDFKSKYSIGNALRYMDKAGSELKIMHPITGRNIIPETYDANAINNMVATLERQQIDYNYKPRADYMQGLQAMPGKQLDSLAKAIDYH